MKLLLNATPARIIGEVGSATYHAHLGCLLSPRKVGDYAEQCARLGVPWAADNDVYGGFDRTRFLSMLRRIRGIPGCQFVTAPDVVADARATLARFALWQPVLRYYGLPVAFVAQDGQEALETPWNEFDALFIGGSTEWKLSQSAAALCREAKARGKWLHFGRVNGSTRVQYARAIGCDSADGTGFARFSRIELPKGIQALRAYSVPMWEGLLC